MSVTERSLALVIEGIGSDPTYTAGIAWTHGRQTIGTPGIYEVKGGTGTKQGLIDPPQSVAATVNPFECSAQGSAFTFMFHASDLAKQLFLSRPIEPADSLAAELDSDTTTLTFSGANYTWSASDDGTVIWIGDEAILLGSYAAGPQFTGCTRAYYSTIAMVQPNGMNAWQKNPFVRNRRAILVLYDHDAATWSQVWQGFVDDPIVNGTRIELAARDLLSVLGQGNINRGKSKALKWPGSPMSFREDYQGRAFRMSPASPGYSGKRVNKANSTSPHWMAVRIGGALYYVNFDSTTGVASASDSSITYAGNAASESLPQLQSEFGEPKGDDLVARELLVVDRHRDHGTNQTDPAYADFRSSSRELEYPFHPVAISLALLTSGYSPTPGEAGTGAAGETPPPAVLASEGYLVDVYQPWANDTEDIVILCCARLTGHALVGSRLGAVASSVKYVDLSDGTVQWTLDNTALSHTSGSCLGLDTDGTDAFVLLYADSASRYVVQSVSLATGTVNWTTQIPLAPSAANSELRGLAYMPGVDQIVVSVEAPGELNILDADGTYVGASSSPTSLSVGYFADESSVLVCDESETVEVFSLPYTDADAKDATLSGFAGRFAAASFSPPQIRADRDGGTGAWLSTGYTSTYSAIMSHLDPTTPSVDVTHDVSVDTNLGASGTIAGHAIDKDGRIYVLYMEGAAASDYVEIIVYDTDGTTVLWDSTDMRGPYGNAATHRYQIDITEDGYLVTGGNKGEILVYKVATWSEPDTTGYGSTWSAGTAETSVYGTGSEDVGGMERLGDSDDEFVMYPYAAMGYAGALQVRSGVDLTQSHTWDSSTVTYNYNQAQSSIAVDRSGSLIYWAHRGGGGYSIQAFDFNLTAQWTGDGVTGIALAGAKSSLALVGTTLWRLDSGGDASDLGTWTSLGSDPPTTGTAYDPDGTTHNGDLAASADDLTLFWTDSVDTLHVNTIAGIDGTSEYTVNLAAGVLDENWATVTRPKTIACPTNTDAVWCFPGKDATAGSVCRVDSTGTVEVQIDWKDTPFARAWGTSVKFGAGYVDKHGAIYCLLHLQTSPYPWTVAKFSNSGVYITDSWSQGLHLDVNRIPTTLCVTGLSGYIVLGDDDGQLRSISQA